MTCEQRKDLILLYVVDALDEGDADEIRTHLAGGCATCEASLSEARATLTAIPLGIGPTSAPPDLRSRLMARIAHEQRSDHLAAIPLPLTRSTPNLLFASWLSAGVAAAIVGGIVYFAVSEPLKKQVADLSRRMASLQTEVAALQGEQQRSTQSIQIQQSPATQLVSLPGTPAAPKAVGRIYWDHSRDLWEVRTSGLPPLAPGRVYELWLIPAGKAPLRSETFVVDSQGNGSVTTLLPRGVGAIAQAAITEEPVGGNDKPTTPLLIAGAVQ